MAVRGQRAEAEAIRRAYAMGGELRDAAHAAERLAEIQRHLGRDPHLDYTTITNEVGAPPTPLAERTALTVITQEGDQEVRFDAREKFPGALAQLGLEGAFEFTDDEAGRQAREALVEAQRSGRSVSIESGIGIQMATVPVGLRGVMTDEPVFGAVTLAEATSAAPAAPPPTLVEIISAGEHEIGMAFAPTDEPVEEWDDHRRRRRRLGDLPLHARRARGARAQARLATHVRRGGGAHFVHARERHADHAELACAHRCPEDAIRACLPRPLPGLTRSALRRQRALVAPVMAAAPAALAAGARSPAGCRSCRQAGRSRPRV